MALMTNKNQLSEFLKQVAEALDIPEEMRAEVEREYQQLCEFLEEQDADANRKEPKIYPQGSFRLGTVIRPITDTDEYDIDLVYERDLLKSSTTREQLKAETGQHLEAYRRYLRDSNQDVPELEQGDRCWTLDHEGEFHMDILPAIPDEEARGTFDAHAESAISITDKSSAKWETSNPIGFCEWFREQMREQFVERRKAMARAELTKSASATRSAYAAQLVAYMCVEHLKANNQSWPTSWAELDDDLDAGFAQSGQKLDWTISDLKQRVDVNWNADLEQLESNPGLDPVVWISDFPEREQYMTSPNEIVSRFLKSINAHAK